MDQEDNLQEVRDRALEAAEALPDDFASWSPADVKAALAAIAYTITDIKDDEWDEIEKKSRRGGMSWRNLYLKMLAHMKNNKKRTEQFVSIIAFTIRRGTRLVTWKKFQSDEVKAEIDETAEDWELKTGAQLENGDFSAMRLLRLSGSMGAFVAMKVFGRDTSALHYLATMPFWPSLFAWPVAADIAMAAYTAFLKGAWEKARLVKCTPPMELNAQWLNNQMFIWKGLWPLEKNEELTVEVWKMAGEVDGKAYIVSNMDGTIDYAPPMLAALLEYTLVVEDAIRTFVRNVTFVDITPRPAAPGEEPAPAAQRRPALRR